MNGVKEEMHVRVEQTARGIWYCSSLDVYAENTVDLKLNLDNLMCEVELMLQKHNSLHSAEETHADLSTAPTPSGKKARSNV